MILIHSKLCSLYSDVGFYYLLLYFFRHHDTGIITSAQAKVSELVEHYLLQENCIHEIYVTYNVL